MLGPLHAPALALLCGGTFLVSFFVAAIGPTGGLQLAVVAATLPAQIAIPMHAWITGFSALFRVSNLLDEIDWKFVWRFSLFSVLASGLAIQITFDLNSNILRMLIGAYLIVVVLVQLVWPGGSRLQRLGNPYVSGGITGALTVFFGATGPLVYALLGPRFPKKETLQASYSACLVVQHLSKIALFGVMGISILQYPVLLLVVLFASWAGSFLGNHVLLSLNEKFYRTALNTTLVLSGVVLIFGF